MLTPGGGGYGDPFARDPALVQRDVRRGYYTPEAASELFGVTVNAAGEVDEAETMRLRKGLKQSA